MANCTIIVPCFNEVKRLSISKFCKFSKKKNISFIFVNDGSTDDTSKIIDQILINNQNNQKIDLKHNQGKAEAIRQGFLESIKHNKTDLYGFWDADLSTPLDEIESFIKLLEDDNTIFVFGCRKKTKGSNIQRSLIRHFIGRIIAFIMSTFLQISIYDTQCGAKILKKEYVNTIFKKKFHTKWLFDIEIFLRLIKIKKNKKMHEKVLSEWIDVPGSKLSYFNTFEIINEIIKIFFYYKIKKFHNGSN